MQIKINQLKRVQTYLLDLQNLAGLYKLQRIYQQTSDIIAKLNVIQHFPLEIQQKLLQQNLENIQSITIPISLNIIQKHDFQLSLNKLIFSFKDLAYWFYPDRLPSIKAETTLEQILINSTQDYLTSIDKVNGVLTQHRNDIENVKTEMQKIFQLGDINQITKKIFNQEEVFNNVVQQINMVKLILQQSDEDMSKLKVSTSGEINELKINFTQHQDQVQQQMRHDGVKMKEIIVSGYQQLVTEMEQKLTSKIEQNDDKCLNSQQKNVEDQQLQLQLFKQEVQQMVSNQKQEYELQIQILKDVNLEQNQRLQELEEKINLNQQLNEQSKAEFQNQITKQADNFTSQIASTNEKINSNQENCNIQHQELTIKNETLQTKLTESIKNSEQKLSNQLENLSIENQKSLNSHQLSMDQITSNLSTLEKFSADQQAQNNDNLLQTITKQQTLQQSLQDDLTSTKQDLSAQIENLQQQLSPLQTDNPIIKSTLNAFETATTQLFTNFYTLETRTNSIQKFASHTQSQQQKLSENAQFLTSNSKMIQEFILTSTDQIRDQQQNIENCQKSVQLNKQKLAQIQNFVCENEPVLTELQFDMKKFKNDTNAMNQKFDGMKNQFEIQFSEVIGNIGKLSVKIENLK